MPLIPDNNDQKAVLLLDFFGFYTLLRQIIKVMTTLIR